MNVTAAAIAGLSVLLGGGVLSWDACLSNKSAWNTFTWFAAIIAFAGQLKSLGVVRPSVASLTIRIVLTVQQQYLMRPSTVLVTLYGFAALYGTSNHVRACNLVHHDSLVRPCNIV